MPTISIVTPCLNAATTLERALTSVAAQDYAPVEHIVVDGGSTDGTVDLLKQRSTVRWISEPDCGLSDAMNKGISMATGNIIGWLNADDWYLPGTFAAIASAAVAYPDTEWFTGRCLIVDGDGNRIRRPISAYKNALLHAYSFPLYLTQNFISCPATFVRLGAYRAVGTYRLGYRYSMDYDLFLRLARRGRPVILHRDLAAFSMTEDTKSMLGFETQFEEHRNLAHEHGYGHPIAVKVNAAMSASIVATYRGMRWLRTR